MTWTVPYTESERRQNDSLMMALMLLWLLASVIFEVRGVYGAGVMMIVSVGVLIGVIWETPGREILIKGTEENFAAPIIIAAICICTIGVNFSCMVADREVLWQLAVTVMSLELWLIMEWMVKFVWLMWPWR